MLLIILATFLAPSKTLTPPEIHAIPVSPTVVRFWTYTDTIDGILIDDEYPWGANLSTRDADGVWTFEIHEGHQNRNFNVHLVDQFGIRRVVKVDRFGYRQ